MSDLLYSTEAKPVGLLSGYIQDIYHEDLPKVSEFHGEWGSLAVSRNLYNGFQPYESTEHLVVVIGGPVLTFRDNRFLTGDEPAAGTLAVYQRFLAGTIQWDEDLSGPFTVLIVEKSTKQIRCITDLMLTIPVYQYLSQDQQVALGTHVDALAQATGQREDIDYISLADFALNGVITYPYSTYKHIRQCAPATCLYFQTISGRVSAVRQTVYWEPFDAPVFDKLNEAADKLRNSVSEYIKQVTESMGKVALFISGGEDARAVAGFLPGHLNRDAFVFLEHMNREGRIARKVASAYGLNFKAIIRNSNYYLDILPEATRLIGSGQQYHQAHTIRLYKECHLNEYPAVFGGYLANALLKAFDARKSTFQKKLSFLYETVTIAEGHSRPLTHEYFHSWVLTEIDQRRQELLSILSKYRIDSVHEWFMNWPRTMGPANASIAVNRRLFRSYEPFLSNDVIKIAAASPVAWKSNRRLFHKAMKPAFEKSKYIPHAKGWYPYYPWWANIPVRIIVGLSRRVGHLTGYIKGHQGSWGDRTKLLNSDSGKRMFQDYAEEVKYLQCIINTSDLELDKLSTQQKFNLLQVLNLFSLKAEIKNKSVISVK